MRRSSFGLWPLAFSLTCSLSTLVLNANAEVSVSVLFTNHMVVQRNEPVHVWGDAAPKEDVAVSFRGQNVTVRTNKFGQWSLYLSPGQAGGPFSMEIKGTNTIVIQDVLVGDVWLASGQSNMEFPMSDLNRAHAEIAAANDPAIRLFRVKKRTSAYPLDDIEAQPWKLCNPENVADFSAVAYFFARDIRHHEHIPIGIIESDWGGTPAEAWTSMDALTASPALMQIFAERARMTDGWEELLREERLEGTLERIAKEQGKSELTFPWHPDLQTWAPSVLYNAMIAPLTQYRIRGVIWYQGESNTGIGNTGRSRADMYFKLFKTLISDWRHQWGEGSFPFLYVQLANFADTPADNWPEVRDAQRRALVLRNTGMAVTIDIGNPDDIHPKDKSAVGYRLALIAYSLAYGENVEYSGPLFRELTSVAGGLEVWFSHVGGGLAANGSAVRGFEIAGADKQFLPAKAVISGQSVIVSSPAIAHPVYVRYAWANNPKCNLFNKNGLPASPFEAGLQTR